MSHYFKNKKVLLGSVAILAVGVSGFLLLNGGRETSEIKEIKTETAPKITTAEIKENESYLIFDEKSKETRDGIKIIQGDYKIEDVLVFADLKNFQVKTGNFQPTKEEALLQARLSKPLVGQSSPDLEARPGDTLVVSVKATENGEEKPELSARAAKFVIGSKQGDQVITEALLGLKMFTPTTKELKFPENHVDATLAGRTITYTFEVVQLARPEEPTEEEVDAVYNALVENAKYSNEYLAVSEAKKYLRENSEVKAYPAKVIVRLQNEYEQFFFGEKYKNEEEFFEKTKTDKNEYYAGRSEYVRSKMMDELLLEALSNQTGINRSSQEFKDASNDIFTEDQKRELLFELTLKKAI